MPLPLDNPAGFIIHMFLSPLILNCGNFNSSRVNICLTSLKRFECGFGKLFSHDFII